MLRVLILTSAFCLVAIPTEALACGSVAHSFWSHALEANKERLQSFLESQTCSDAERYSPERAEPYIAIVIINAIHAGVERQVVEDAFAKFNCVSLVRQRSGYEIIADFLGKDVFSSICDENELGRMYLVRASGGANLRKTGSGTGARIGAIAEGALVKNGRWEGDWLLVDTYIGTGYMHRSTLKPYLGES